MQALFPPSTEELTRAQDRLATAKDADDQEQAALRVAKANATVAKKELAAALRGWRAILRQANGEPDDQDAADDEADEAEDDEDADDEPEDAPAAGGRPPPAQAVASRTPPVHAGRRHRRATDRLLRMPRAHPGWHAVLPRRDHGDAALCALLRTLAGRDEPAGRGAVGRGGVAVAHITEEMPS
jgi:hypothetical protein